MKIAAQRIMELFAGFESSSGTHWTPELDQSGMKWAIKKTARTLKEPVTLDLWKQHLAGKRPLGIVPIREDSLCKWGSIDIDQYDINVLDVVKKVEAAKLPLVPCRSKSGGLHLFLFTTNHIEAEKVQSVLRDIAASLGFAGSEIFPKQTKILTAHGDQGSWMVMPYYGDDFGGKLKFQYGLKKTGAEMGLEEFLTFAEKRSLTEEKLDELRLSVTKVAPPTKGKKGAGSKSSNESKVPFGNGPPCLQFMAEGGFPADGRKRALFMIGIFLKRAHPNEWTTRLDQDNQAHIRPPLPAEEVDSIIKSLSKKDYEYTCKEQPMASHCNSVVCRGRKFGVGIGGEYPVIESITKLDTDPPLWFVTIPGGGRLSMLTEELTNYRKFHNACVAKSNVCFKLLRDDMWLTILSEALQHMDPPIPASPEVGTRGMFVEMLETFLTNRTRGTKREDLLRGAPWEDEEAGRHYFQLAPLEKFLQREGMKGVTRPHLVDMVRDVLKGDKDRLNIKGRYRHVWWVPSSAITPVVEIDPPDMKKEDI